jgi:tetratricopeptide (TPR) repeat protein
MTEETQEKVVNAYQIAMRGDFDHARMILEEALYEDSDNIEAWLLLADLADDQDEARQCYQMVLEISPDNWIAQQRLKLLFGQQLKPAAADEDGMFNQFETEDDFPALEMFSLDDEEEETESDPDTDKVSLKDSFNENRKFFLSVGAGFGALLLLMIVGWVASIGFIAWRMGYLVLGG